MKYNFDNYLANIPQRSLKFDAIKATKSNDFEKYLSMGVADMSFKPPQEVLNVIKREIETGFLGYYGGIESYKKEVVNWLKTRHNWKTKPEWINTAHGLVAAIGTVLRAFTSETDVLFL